MKPAQKILRNALLYVGIPIASIVAITTLRTYFQHKQPQAENIVVVWSQNKADSGQAMRKNGTDYGKIELENMLKYLSLQAQPYACLTSDALIKNILESSAAKPDSAQLKDATGLFSGPYGRKIISEALQKCNYWVNDRYALLGYDHDLVGEAKAILAKTAMDEAYPLFLKMQPMRRDFLEEFDSLRDLQVKNNVAADSLKNAASAFYYVMKKYQIQYLAENSFSRGLSENHLDCDLSGYLFIQFGREAGLDLIGVNMEPIHPDSAGHFAVALRENGRITHYIETTNLLWDKSCEDSFPSAAERASAIPMLQEGISDIKYKISFDSTMLALLENPQDSAKALQLMADNYIRFSYYAFSSEQAPPDAFRVHLGRMGVPEPKDEDIAKIMLLKNKEMAKINLGGREYLVKMEGSELNIYFNTNANRVKSEGILAMKNISKIDSIVFSLELPGEILYMNNFISGSSCGIYSKDTWEANNKGKWSSITYAEASDLR